MNSWQTSSAGVAAILVSLGGLIKGFADKDMGLMATSITGIITGIGLLKARDNNKTSEQVGAGKDS